MQTLQTDAIIGTARFGNKTKDLVYTLKKGDIAVINHENLDELAANSLYKIGVKAVVNLQNSMTGEYCNKGPKLLLDNQIPLIDQMNNKFITQLKSNEEITILENEIFQRGKLIGVGNRFTKSRINEYEQIAYNNFKFCLKKFVDNTLNFANQEHDLILNNLFIKHLPKGISKLIQNRHCLIVIRGPNFNKDLYTMSKYIKSHDPVLIGVDGAADTLLEFDFVPDIVLGDMDSVSDRALSKAKYLLVHAYLNGRVPAANRLQNKFNFYLVKAAGTSEDLAMLLTYQLKASLIVTIGSHTHMNDFLEKGRYGMSSSFLTRMLLGDKLVDAKGISFLYSKNVLS